MCAPDTAINTQVSFRPQYSFQDFSDTLTLKLTPRCFETSLTIRPSTQRHTQENLNLWYIYYGINASNGFKILAQGGVDSKK
jgi:hypothetical protein